MQISVKTITGDTITLDVDLSDTIASIKTHVLAWQKYTYRELEPSLCDYKYLYAIDGNGNVLNDGNPINLADDARMSDYPNAKTILTFNKDVDIMTWNGGGNEAFCDFTKDAKQRLAEYVVASNKKAFVTRYLELYSHGKNAQFFHYNRKSDFPTLYNHLNSPFVKKVCQKFRDIKSKMKTKEDPAAPVLAASTTSLSHTPGGATQMHGDNNLEGQPSTDVVVSSTIDDAVVAMTDKHQTLDQGDDIASIDLYGIDVDDDIDIDMFMTTAMTNNADQQQTLDQGYDTVSSDLGLGGLDSDWWENSAYHRLTHWDNQSKGPDAMAVDELDGNVNALNALMSPWDVDDGMEYLNHVANEKD